MAQFIQNKQLSLNQDLGTQLGRVSQVGFAHQLPDVSGSGRVFVLPLILRSRILRKVFVKMTNFLLFWSWSLLKNRIDAR